MSDNSKLSVSDKVLRAIEPLIYAKRALSMGILLVLTALFAWQMTMIRSDAGFDKSIPLEHPYMQVLKQYQADFGGANTVLIALIQKDGDIYNEKFLTRLKSVTDDVFFLKGVDRSRVSSIFTPDVRFIEVVEGGFKGGNVIPAEYQPNQEMFDLIRGNVAKGGHIGRYVSNDQRGAMIFAELLEVDPVTGEKLDYGQMAKKLEEIRQKYEDDDIKVHVVGFAKVVGDVIEATEEVVIFFIITLVMTFVLLWLYLGSFKLALLPLVCSITAVIWEFGLLRLFGYGLDPFAILVPFLILAVSVSHGVQYVNAWVGEIAENGRNAFDASLFTWRRLAIYGTFAILTDVAGFATIYLIPIDIIREMAINACFGMAAIIITNKVMMPIWLTWVSVGDPKAFAAKQEKRDSIFDGLWRLLSNMVKPVPAVTAILISAVLFGWALWEGKGLQIGDSQTGVPELLPDSRFNQDFRAVNENFAIGVDILKIIAETDPEACVKFDVMDQIDRFAWRLDNLPGVQSTLSLPQAAKLVNSAFSEANPKYLVLPRNQYVMAQAITPIPTSTGLLSPNCSAMAVFTFMRDHKATTVNRVVDEVKAFNKENAADFFDTNKDVDHKYCDAKLEARRDVGVARTDLQKTTERIKARSLGISDDDLAKNDAIVKATTKVSDAQAKLDGMDKACPVNFALATGNVGVMAATNEEVHRLEKLTLLYVYIAIVACVYLSFFEWKSLASILLPLSLVSWMAYAVMSLAGIGMKVATLPIVSLAVGIGVDYGIYVYATLKDAVAGGYKLQEAYYKTLKMTGKAVIFTGITLGLGVATWLWSGLQFQRDMGLLLVFMFTANMFGAILVLPAIASFLLKERELAPGEKPTLVSKH
ncbi:MULTISPECIES: efflux RND transporter permease subunit [Hydrocarboniphaga]|uniref:SSD domain-containing protein n=1 Tax=Hydrocarboniphaga effusa AP103 TaxID=1172194 RepID=I7ZBE7_9GAMM|nr:MULTISPECIES: MMPL family transporter [Hydrocarboniphaga]EIT69204.1 hypothetical protein WQQ_27860 [Hydrocarboniphaga effusa AP103]MDZ4078050.1 MMPL family transporter [Hydrocarboniphaga sp.]